LPRGGLDRGEVVVGEQHVLVTEISTDTRLSLSPSLLDIVNYYYNTLLDYDKYLHVIMDESYLKQSTVLQGVEWKQM